MFKAVSCAYMIGDYANEGWRVWKVEIPMHPRISGDVVGYCPVSARKDYRAAMAQRVVFHALASVAVPALVVKGVVNIAHKAVKHSRLPPWTPSCLGLAVIPLMP